MIYGAFLRDAVGDRLGSVTAQTDRILVVEDDSLVSEMLCDLLKSEGFQTSAVYNGSEAIGRVESEKPDAILLDVMLPGMSGFDICKKLKLKRETNSIPILMLTALSDTQSRKSGLRVGANRYLTKPIDPNLLLRELRENLHHHRQMVEGPVRSHVELQMESDSQLRQQLNDLLDELFHFTPLSGEDISRLRYAVLEMTENAIEWGNRRKRDLTVTIGYEVNVDHVKFVISDEGAGFDPSVIPHAATVDDPVAHMDVRDQLGLRAGGFGILITKGRVDEVKYNERGNQVTLIKRFPGRETAGEDTEKTKA